MSKNTLISRIIIVAAFSLLGFWSNGQNQTIQNLKVLMDTTTANTKATDKAKLKHVLRNEFALITTPGNIGTIGNFVALGTDDNTLTFAYNFARDYSIFQIGASGGITDDVFSLITNSDLNTGVGLTFKYHRIIAKASTIEFNDDEFQALKKKDAELTKVFNAELYKAKSNPTQKKLKKVDANIKKKQSEIAKLKKDINAMENDSVGFIDKGKHKELSFQEQMLIQEVALLEKQVLNADSIIKIEISKLETKRNLSSNLDPTKEQQFKVDSIKVYEIPFQLSKKLKERKKKLSEVKVLLAKNEYSVSTLTRLKKELKVATDSLNILVTERNYINEFDAYDIVGKSNKFEEESTENLLKINDIRPTDLKLTWITFGGEFSYQSFSLFDRTLAQEDQIFSEKDFVPSFNFAVTHYLNKDKMDLRYPDARKIRYAEFGATLSYGNNIGSLSKLNIETTDSISPNRSVVSSASAYNMSAFQADQLTARFTGDFYQFIGNTSNVGFHLRGILNVSKSDFPVISARAGVIFAALKNEDKKSIINFELFFGLNNIFKNIEEDDDEKIFDRNVIGMQTTFPFNFKIK